MAQGVAAEPLTRTIVSLNGALSRRVIEITLARHDLADTDWCWLALGSEGRGEQTFATDQDNALVFAAVDDADAAAAAAGAAGVRRRRQRRARRTRLSALHRQRDGEQSRAVPVGRGVARPLPAVAARADAAGAAAGEHRVRLPAALRRHDALGRAARLAARLHAGQPAVPPPDGAERAGGRAAARPDPGVRRRRRTVGPGHRRPQDSRDPPLRRRRAGVRAGRRHRGDRHRRPPARGRRRARGRARGTSRRRSRHSISCSCCGCGSSTCPARTAPRTASIRMRSTKSTSRC